MGWVAGNDVTTGDLITAAQWNNYMGATGSLEYLYARHVNWLTASVQKVSDLNRTATLAYTDLDLTADTSATARFAFLTLKVNVDSSTNGAAFVRVRRNGDTPTYVPELRVDGDLYATAASTVRDTQQSVICGLDAGQILEYSITIGGTIQVDTTINLLGYING